MSAESLADYVEYVVQSLVDDVDAVGVETTTEDEHVYVDIDVAREERGRVIGRQGRLIRSLRVVVRAASGRAGQRASVEMVDIDDE